MYGAIAGFPCNAGGTLVCLGQPGVTRGKCAPNTCTTLAWSTTPNAAGCTTADQSPPGGQCRHQQICIQGFGATLDCDPSDQDIDHTCSVGCGGSASLKLCVAGGTSPYVFRLWKVINAGQQNESRTLVERFPASGTTNDTCHTFAPAVTETTVFEGEVTDAAGCVRKDRATVTTTPISVTLAITGGGTCTNGALTLTATPSGLANYKFFVDDLTTPVQDGTGNTYSYPSDPDTNCHTVRVTATNAGGCSASDTKSITQCVNTTVGTAACS
jgi:hypothetical protein